MMAASDRNSVPGSVITRAVSLARRFRDKVTGLTATVRLSTERAWSTLGPAAMGNGWPAPPQTATPTLPGIADIGADRAERAQR